MYKIDKLNSQAFHSDSGESVYALVGPNANGSEGYSLAACEIAAGGSSQAHYHPVVEETYCITEGSGYMIIDDTHIEVVAGDTIVVPALASHQVFNNTNKALKFLAFCIPEWTPECSTFIS